jgi:hypothetical protein
MKRLIYLLALSLSAQQAPPAPKETQAAKEETPPAAEPAPPAAEAPAPERVVTGSIEFGYRTIHTLSGNFDAYRSVVNLGEGPKLFDADLRFRPPSSSLFTEGTLLMRNWGGEPYSSLRFDLYKDNIYNLTVDYRNLAYFNSLSSFANPKIETGSLASQYSFDTRVRSTDVRLDLYPSSRISPYLAYSRVAENGSGVWVFPAEGNEYPTPTGITNRTDHYRGGVNIRFRNFHLGLEQGGAFFADDQGAGETALNRGNRTQPFFGRTLALADLREYYRVRGHSYYSRGSVAWDPVSWANLAGDFVYTNPVTEVTYSQSATGQLVIPGTLLFASRNFDSFTGRAQMPHPSGSVRGEVRPVRQLRIVETFYTDRMHNAASGFLAEQYLATGSVTNLQTSSTDRLVLNQNRQQIDVIFEPVKFLTVRGGHRYTWGDTTVRGAQLSGLALKSADMRRHTGLAGLGLRSRGIFRFNADFEAASTERAFFRTSLRNYRRLNMLGSVSPGAGSAWRFIGGYRWLTNTNPDPAVKWDFDDRAASAGIEWFPNSGRLYSVLTEYTRSTTHSMINYIVPQFFIVDRLWFRENANAGTLAFRLAPGGRHKHQPGLHLGGTLYASTGSRPTRYYQPFARATVPLAAQVHVNGEWRWYSMTQAVWPVENFASHQFIVSLTLLR